MYVHWISGRTLAEMLYYGGDYAEKNPVCLVIFMLGITNKNKEMDSLFSQESMVTLAAMAVPSTSRTTVSG